MSYLRWDEGTAHPRAGGENQAAADARTPDTGSSPRGRGKPTATLDDWRVGGLIPARAGKTHDVVHLRMPGRAHPRPAARPYRVRAHPRAGGEN